MAVGRGVAGASTEGWAAPWAESRAWAARIFFWAAGEKGTACWLALSTGGGWGLAAPAPAPALTDAACVLELDLQHLHGGGHNHLAGARAAARQHLLQQRQLLPGREKVGPPGVSGSGGAEPPASDTPPASPATDTEPGRQTAHGQGLGRAVGHSIF